MSLFTEYELIAGPVSAFPLQEERDICRGIHGSGNDDLGCESVISILRYEIVQYGVQREEQEVKEQDTEVILEIRQTRVI